MYTGSFVTVQLFIIKDVYYKIIHFTNKNVQPQQLVYGNDLTVPIISLMIQIIFKATVNIIANTIN